MYHGQYMLVPVLTVERTDLVTLSKHEVTRGKEKKKPGNDHELPVSRILWNSLKDSKEFYTPEMDIKTDPITEERKRVASNQQVKIIYVYRVGAGFFTRWIWRDNW